MLRGVIDPASLGGLLKPDYQRETLRKATIEGLMEAFRRRLGRVPDVELAVRGERYGCTDSNGTYTITGDVYIIDGLQRISAARQFVSDGGKPLVGAMLHFGTTEEWERERFDILNMRRTRLSPNVLLRNRAAQCPSLRRLYDLCSDESFVLCQRVSWSQYMRREELLTALSFLKTVMRLHSKFGAGRYGVRVRNLAGAAAHDGQRRARHDDRERQDVLSSSSTAPGVSAGSSTRIAPLT